VETIGTAAVAVKAETAGFFGGPIHPPRRPIALAAGPAGYYYSPAFFPLCVTACGCVCRASVALFLAARAYAMTARLAWPNPVFTYRTAVISAAACFLLPVISGCQQGGPFGQASQGPVNGPPGAAGGGLAAQQQQQYAAQLQNLQQRVGAFDANNSQLHQDIAGAQKQLLLAQQETNLLRQRLADTANLLVAERQAKQDAQKRIEVLEASTRARGGAVIRPNNSLAADLPDYQDPGVFVRLDEDVVRIELSSDRIFQPGTANLNADGVAVIDRIAADIARRYPGKQIGVEGHTSQTSAGGATAGQAHQISASQALIVFQRLSANPGIAAERLYITGHGGNHPVVSNATPQGQARNRRIELVVYPTT
jgi:flagellar motor protein MotB